MSAAADNVLMGSGVSSAAAGTPGDAMPSASQDARRAQQKIEATRAALLAKIDRQDPSGPIGRRPTVASLLGDARRAVFERPAAASASMTDKMAAASSSSSSPAPAKPSAPSAVSEMGLARAARSMLGHLPIPPLVPVVESALDSAEAWWRKQPWYDASDLLLREAESALGPLIRRNPLMSVSAAAAVGAAVVMARPWRWKALETSLKPLPQQTKAWFSEQMQRSTVQSLAVAWVLGLVAKAGTKVAADADDVADRMSRASPPASTGDAGRTIQSAPAKPMETDVRASVR